MGSKQIDVHMCIIHSPVPRVEKLRISYLAYLFIYFVHILRDSVQLS